jgi:hypothetical protein
MVSIRRHADFQVRAWNRQVEAPENSSRAAVELAAGHLFGLLMGLGLRQNARAIAFHVQARGARLERSPQFWTRDDAAHLAERADEEVRRLLPREDTIHSSYELELPIDSEMGPIRATLATSLVRLVKVLGRSDEWEKAAAALEDADAELDDWQASKLKDSGRKSTDTLLRCGVEYSFPPAFEREVNLRI